MKKTLIIIFFICFALGVLARKSKDKKIIHIERYEIVSNDVDENEKIQVQDTFEPQYSDSGVIIFTVKNSNREKGGIYRIDIFTPLIELASFDKPTYYQYLYAVARKWIYTNIIDEKKKYERMEYLYISEHQFNHLSEIQPCEIEMSEYSDDDNEYHCIFAGICTFPLLTQWTRLKLYVPGTTACLRVKIKYKGEMSAKITNLKNTSGE
jgi:hypothetical protein